MCGRGEVGVLPFAITALPQPFSLFLKDLPAAALPRTRMSRREFRKLHFIAKEDEEEEEEDVA